MPLFSSFLVGFISRWHKRPWWWPLLLSASKCATNMLHRATTVKSITCFLNLRSARGCLRWLLHWNDNRIHHLLVELPLCFVFVYFSLGLPHTLRLYIWYIKICFKKARCTWWTGTKLSYSWLFPLLFFPPHWMCFSSMQFHMVFYTRRTHNLFHVLTQLAATPQAINNPLFVIILPVSSF